MSEKEPRRKLPPLASLPQKWQAEYRRVVPLAIERYGAQWGSRAECEYQIHLYVYNCWQHEIKTQGQGLLFA